MNQQGNVLVVEDEKGSRLTLTVILEEEGHQVVALETAEQALNHIIERPTDLVISDLELPDGSGLQILWALKRINPDASLILVTGHASQETAIEAVNQGAYAYHVKPLDMDALNHSVRNALKQQNLQTENKALLEKLQLSNQNLRNSNIHLEDEVEELSLTKSQILAAVTHELNTPLAGILGNLDLLLDPGEAAGPLNEKHHQYLGSLKKDANRLNGLIENILETSRLETGGLQLAVTALDVGAEIDEAVGSLREDLRDRCISLVINIPKHLPAVKVDRFRFARILSNLIGNACKFSFEGAMVQVSAEATGGAVEIVVSDSGIGISPEDQLQVFNKFFRVDNSSTRGTPGAGLGLYIVKNLVEAHGGAARVESRLQEGSAFTITLPCLDAEGPGYEDPGEVLASSSPPPGSSVLRGR